MKIINLVAIILSIFFFYMSSAFANTPPNPTLIGSIAGGLSVDFSGNANYTIPLKLPDGVAGMNPSVSLSYNNSLGNGIMGVGWSINNLSQISRCPKNIAIDGYKDRVRLDRSDAICMDGIRLIPVPIVSGEGSCDVADDVVVGNYKTELFNYNRIVACKQSLDTGPSYFKVWQKNGRIKYYGGTSNARIKLKRSTSTPPVTVVSTTWKINKEKDTKGNYIEYEYHNTVSEELNPSDNPSSNSREIMLSEIRYTGNSNTSLTPNRKVVFVYEEREDKGESYLAGSSLDLAKLLSKIEIRFDNDIIKNYYLEYITGGSSTTGRPLLEYMHECSISELGIEECISPTKFNWQQGKNGFEFAGSYTAGFEIKDSVIADMNGDGRQDLVYIHDYNKISILEAGDYDASGIANFDNVVSFQVDNYPKNIASFQVAAYPHIDPFEWFQLIDYNADGLMDFVAPSNLRHSWYDTSLNWIVYLNTGSGFERKDTGIYNSYATQPILGMGQVFNMYTQRFVVADINGDGFQDVITWPGKAGYSIYGEFKVILNSETGFVNQAYNISEVADDGTIISDIMEGEAYASSPNKRVDFNGDGRDDLLIRRADFSCSPYLSEYNGSNFSFKKISTNIACDTAFTTDINADGLTDIRGTTKLWVSSGEGFDEKIYTNPIP